MCWVAGVDETASETQKSEGWTYAVLPDVAISKIDSEVSNCSVKAFHGKKFNESQRKDYEIFLTATRNELIKHQNASLMFTLLEASWKSVFLDFTESIITQGISGTGVSDFNAINIAKHLFPGLITLQRLTADANLTAIDIKIDSDDISEKLANLSISIKDQSIPLAKLLGWAYETHRKQMFPNSPKLGNGGIRALKDAKSRAIQVADVFGNFALSYIFIQLGDESRKRKVKADIFGKIFSEIKPEDILGKAKISESNKNDIELTEPGGLTLYLRS